MRISSVLIVTKLTKLISFELKRLLNRKKLLLRQQELINAHNTHKYMSHQMCSSAPYDTPKITPVANLPTSLIGWLLWL